MYDVVSVQMLIHLLINLMMRFLVDWLHHLVKVMILFLVTNIPIARGPPDRYGWITSDSYAPQFQSFRICNHHEPESYQKAVQSSEWRRAMEDEFHALQKTHTWDFVPLPAGKSLISCKWIYKIKTTVDGSIERYKAQLQEYSNKNME